MKKKSIENEPHFRVVMEVPARHLGHIIAAGYGLTRNSDVQLIKELHSEKNVPKGDTKAAFIEQLSKHKGKMDFRALRDLMKENGYTASAFYWASKELQKEKAVTRKGELIQLNKIAAGV